MKQLAIYCSEGTRLHYYVASVFQYQLEAMSKIQAPVCQALYKLPAERLAQIQSLPSSQTGKV